MVTTATYPVAPPTTPIKGTLLDTATVRDGITWLDGKDLWSSASGMKFGSPPKFCRPDYKDLEDNELEWVSGFLMGAYGGFTCKAVGTSLEEMQDLASKQFDLGESTAVERGVMFTRFVDQGVGSEYAGLWDGPVDITPAGGAVKPALGLAILEGSYNEFSTSAPTIHMPRVIASLLAGVKIVEGDGDRLSTELGSLVVAGVGYDNPNSGPDGTEAPAGEKWIYASGPVFVGRGDKFVQASLNQSNNDAVILAERPYIVALDGPVLAVRVKVEA